MKDKPGNYGLSLVDMTDHYVSRVILCVTPPINNPKEKENIHDLVMRISEDILITERNITRGRLYSSIDTLEELAVQEKTTHVGIIMPYIEKISRSFKNSKRVASPIFGIYVWKQQPSYDISDRPKRKKCFTTVAKQLTFITASDEGWILQIKCSVTIYANLLVIAGYRLFLHLY